MKWFTILRLTYLISLLEASVQLGDWKPAQPNGFVMKTLLYRLTFGRAVFQQLHGIRWRKYKRNFDAIIYVSTAQPCTP